MKHFVFDYYYYDIAKCVFSSFAMYIFVSHFVISNAYELFGVAAMGVFVYIFLMLIIGGFSKCELSAVIKYTPSKNLIIKILYCDSFLKYK